MSARKPLIITCGERQNCEDLELRDAGSGTCESFAEDPLSIAFHPSGLHCAIGFNDKIRLAHLRSTI